ncbi:MAG: flippase [Candidatus Paceibacterota bacterium]|jgi:O-antigen/teichoic acid export membrane protein
MFTKIKIFLLSNKNINQVLVKNTFWLAFGEITGRLLKLIIIFYAIRILGVSDWGTFSYVISLCGLFMIFSDIGLASILTRELAKNETEKNKYIATSFSIKIILNILIFTLIILFAPLFAKDNLSLTLIPLVGLLMVFEGIRDFTFAINRSMEKMEVEAFVKIITNLLIILFAYIFLVNSKTVFSLALGYMLGSLSGMIFTLIIFRKYLKNMIKNFSKDLIKPLIIIAWPFSFFAILGSVMSNTDVVMLGWIKGTREVGFYATSQRIIAFLYIIPGLLTSSLLPTLSKEIRDKEKIKNVVHSLIKIVYLFSIPVIFGGLVIGDNLIIKLFGSEYIPTISIFQVSLLSILFVSPALIFNSIIFIFNKHSSIIKISFIGTIMNILINILLIPKYGGIGASIATLISQFVIMILIKKELGKIIELKIFSGLFKIILASILMSIFLYILKYLNLNLYLLIILAIFLYFIILIKIKEESLFKIKNIFKQ